MLNNFAWRASASPLLALGLVACGGAEVLLIPLFEFGFSGSSGGVTVRVFLGPDRPTTSEGTFDLANLSLDGAPPFGYTGSFSGCTIRLSTTAAVPAPAAASYNGSFTGNDSIELRPTSGNNLPVLVLQRQGTGTRVTGC